MNFTHSDFGSGPCIVPWTGMGLGRALGPGWPAQAGPGPKVWARIQRAVVKVGPTFSVYSVLKRLVDRLLSETNNKS